MGFLVAMGRPYIPGGNDLGPFAAECLLIAAMTALLVVPFFARRRNHAAFVTALIGLAAALAGLLWFGPTPASAAPPLHGILIADPFAMFWKAMLLVFVIGIALLWRSVSAMDMHEGDGPEFFVLLLGATLGMCLMASTTNLLMIFMAVELASFPSYVMAGFRKTHRRGAEASLKYVLFGAAASAIMLYAMTFLYGLYGTLEISEMARKLGAGAAGGGPMAAIALFGLIVGIGFKIAAVPFHFWCPDVFEGAGVDVSAFLSVASKGAGLVLLLRVMMTIADARGYQPAQPLTALAAAIGALGALTATVGNTAALAQNNIKRLLAYSSIAHAGYMLCVVSLLYAGRVSPTNPATGLNAPAQVLLFYLAVYLFMNLGAFAVAGLVGRAANSEDLSAFHGLARRHPILAHAMAACMISLIGLPPFAGFIAKLNVLFALMSGGGWWWILVAVVAVNSIISAFYYFRVLRAMYLQPADEGALAAHPLGVALSIVCAAVLVLMLIFASPINTMTQYYGRIEGVRGVNAPARSGIAAADR